MESEGYEHCSELTTRQPCLRNIGLGAEHLGSSPGSTAESAVCEEGEKE